MARAILLACLLALPLMALAQDGGAENAGAGYRNYTAGGYGFRISLPASGTLNTPTSEGWDGNKSEAFIWLAGGAEPIKKVVGRSDSFGTRISAEEFKSFCDALLDLWSQDEEHQRLLTKNKLVKSGAYTWNVIEVEDTRGKERVFYSVFLTYSNENIYTISLYYDRMPTQEIQAFGQPILAGFAPIAE